MRCAGHFQEAKAFAQEIVNKEELHTNNGKEGHLRDETNNLPLRNTQKHKLQDSHSLLPSRSGPKMVKWKVRVPHDVG